MITNAKESVWLTQTMLPPFWIGFAT
jgi:hypothetical protein